MSPVSSDRNELWPSGKRGNPAAASGAVRYGPGPKKRPCRLFLKNWIISDLAEKKFGLLSEKDLFSWGSANRGNPLWPNGSMPGQKSIRLAKKGGNSPFPDAGFCRSSTGIPLSPRLLAETKRGEPGRVLPALFVFGARFLARATRRWV